ncbi:hypothetical protein OAS23_00620 [Alphaproteobacteria bacterium]|nr:hypothetical protein [Alphaproteobacteria bacterium]
MNKKILGLNECAKDCHEAAVKGGWWHDNEGKKKERNVGELLCLIHSEISEAMEGARKGLMDTHLKHKSMMEVELADAIIRIFDLAESKGFNLGETIYEKLEYNKSRADHKIKNRLKEGGKKF